LDTSESFVVPTLAKSLMKEHVMTTDTSTHLMMTVEEAAERLEIGRTLMYALVKSGAIESVCIGRLRRIPEDALIAFVRSLRVGLPRDAA
jgi:excisionase family DNA binding protein